MFAAAAGGGQGGDPDPARGRLARPLPVPRRPHALAGGESGQEPVALPGRVRHGRDGNRLGDAGGRGVVPARGGTVYAYVAGNPINQIDPLGLETVGSFNNGGHTLGWERGVGVRPPDFVKIQLSLYVIGAARTFSTSGKMFVSGSLSRPYPRPNGRLQASVSVGWLNQCEVPAGAEVDRHLNGFGMSGAGGYRGVGGGLNWSPGGGTSTELGIGIGGGFSPGEISKEDGNWGDGW